MHAYEQSLEVYPHPICLELLAHVGYAFLIEDPSTKYGLTSSIAITFLAQWHPLINPERNDLRPEYNNGPAKSNGMF